MRIRILIVEDTTFMRDMMHKSLRDNIHGVETYPVSDVKQARVVLNQHKIDIIISDWEMPGITGEEFLEWIRASEKYVDIPFIMVSSLGDKKYIVKAIKAGVSDYICKPFNVDEFVQKISKQIQKIGKKTGASDSGLKKEKSAVDILTAGRAIPSPELKPAAAVSSPLLASSAKEVKATTEQPTAAKKKPKVSKGQADIMVAGAHLHAAIKDLSLKQICLVLKRCEHLPHLFDTLTVKVIQDSNQSKETDWIQGFVYDLKSMEADINSQLVQLTVQFNESDLSKIEQLSYLI